MKFGEGEEAFTAYCERTEEKNYTIIKIPVKKANRGAFESAIENQLGYVKGVVFYYKKDFQQYPQKVEIEEDRIYETPSLIISGDSPYANLRIGIVTAREEYNPVVIDYGEIDWEQLDMTAIRCPAIFKMPIRSVQKIDGQTVVLQEGVSVTPGREKIIYDENTKEFLLKSIDEVKKETEAYLHEKLKTDNFIQWYHNASAISGGYSSYSSTSDDKILKILRKLVSMETLDLKFDIGKIEVSLIDIGEYFKAVDLKYLDRKQSYKRFNIVYTLDRYESQTISSNTKLYHKPIGSNHNKRTDLYLVANHNGKVATMNDSISERLKIAKDLQDDDTLTKAEQEYWSKLRVKAKIFEALHEEFLKIGSNYEDVDVPEDFKANSDDEYVDDDGNVVAKPKGPTPAEIRRKNQQYLFYDALTGSHTFTDQSKKSFSIKDLQAKETAGEVMYFFTESKNATDSDFYMTSETVMRYMQLFSDIKRYLLTDEEEKFINEGFKNVRIYRTTETNLKAISKDITAVPVEKLFNTKFSKNANDEVEIPYLVQRWMQNEEYRRINNELSSVITIDENVFELYPHVAEKIELLQDFYKYCKDKVKTLYSRQPANLDKLDEYIRDAVRLEKYRFTCDSEKVEHIEKELSLSPYKDIFKPETKWFEVENELKLFKQSHPILFHFANKNMFVDVYDSNGIVVYSKQQMLDDMKKFYPQDFTTN